MTRILVAEDDRIIAKLFALKLKKYQQEGDDWEITVVPDGREAIQAIEKKPPDILLLDLLMPEVDGFAVLEHCNKKRVRFPIIILSNLSQQIDQKKCMELGAKAFFVKSDLDFAVLAEKIHEFLGASSRGER